MLQLSAAATGKDESCRQEGKGQHTGDLYLPQVGLSMVIGEWSPLDTNTSEAPGGSSIVYPTPTSQSPVFFPVSIFHVNKEMKVQEEAVQKGLGGAGLQQTMVTMSIIGTLELLQARGSMDTPDLPF